LNDQELVPFGLHLSLVLFFLSTSGAGMSSDNGTINRNIFHIWILGKISKHTLPDTFFFPTGETFADRYSIDRIYLEAIAIEHHCGISKGLLPKKDDTQILDPHIHVDQQIKIYKFLTIDLVGILSMT
jgi:hypothetical protein